MQKYSCIADAREDGWLLWDGTLPTNKTYFIRNGEVKTKEELLNLPERHAAKIIFEDGNSIKTEFNGTINELINYYMGHTFNVGAGVNDKMVKVSRVEILY